MGSFLIIDRIPILEKKIDHLSLIYSDSVRKNGKEEQHHRCLLIAIAIYLLLQTRGSIQAAFAGGSADIFGALMTILFGGPGVLLLLHVRNRRRKRKAAEREAMNFQTPIGISLLSVQKTKNARPRGITLIACYSLVLGILSILSSAILASFPVLRPMPNDLLSNPLIGIIAGIASTIIAYGLFKREKWGWKWGLIGLYVGSTLAIASTVLTPSGTIYAYTVAGIGLDVLIGYYLYRPHVKAYFGIISNNPLAR